MGTSDTKYFKGKYLQGNMSDQNAAAILALTEDYTVVTSLKHVIKDLHKYQITDIKNEASEYLSNHKTFEGLKTDYTQNAPLGTLSDPQTMGVAFMYYAGSALLGDEVGLGKTVQVAGLMNTLRTEFKNQGKPFHYLFLTEKSIVEQIQEKLIQFTGTYTYHLESAEAKNIKKFLTYTESGHRTSVVGSHSLLNSPEFLTYLAKNPFDAIVFDESKGVKKQSSGLSQNAKSVFKLHQRVILLNATPVETELREVYNQLDLLDPDYMPTVGEFERRFMKKKRAMYGFVPDGFKNEHEFAEMIRLRYYARTRRDLGAKYEDNYYRTVLVPLSPVQKELKKKTSLQQMLVDYPKGVDRKVEFNEETALKLKALFTILEERIDIGMTQAIVYCRYVSAQKEMCQLLQERGYRAVILNGKTPDKKRKEISDAYTQGEYDVMITNVLRGLDLNTCDTAILYTIDANPQNMVQFEGRMTREFDVKNKAVYLLVAVGREKKFVETELKLRVNMSMAFSKTGNSMVLEAISSEENKELFAESDYEDTI